MPLLLVIFMLLILPSPSHAQLTLTGTTITATAGLTIAVGTTLTLPNSTVTSAMLQDATIADADLAAGTFANIQALSGLNQQAALVLLPFGASAGNTSEARFRELAANGVHYLALKAGDSLAANLTFTLPTSDGTSGQFMRTNGSGILSFADALTAVTTTEITDGTIVNADINAAAAIAYSKLSLASSLVTSDITDNTLTTSDLNATLTFIDADLLDLSAINASSATEGLILPQATSVTASTAEGQITWDTDNDTLYIGNSVSATIISGALGATVESSEITDDTIVNADIAAAAAIADSKLATISTAGKVSNAATTAASANTASAIVARDVSGNFTAGTITAALTGNAATATALASNPADCSANQFATTIAANGDLTCAAITGTGTLTSGATGAGFTVALGTSTITGILGAVNGGTGNGFTAFSGPTTATKTFTLPDASATILTSNVAVTVAQGGTGITAGTSGGVLAFTATGTLVSSGALTANGIVLGGGVGAAPTSTSALTDGQLLIGSTGVAPVAAALTGTSNQITVTNGAGSITLSTPQSIHTTATPQFARLGLGAGADATALLATTGQAAIQLNPFNTAAGNTGEIRFLELAANGTNYVGLKAPDAITTNTIWVLPSADGTNGQVVQTNGAGTLSFATLPIGDESVVSADITDNIIQNVDISATAAIVYSKLNLTNSLVATDIATNAVTAAKLGTDFVNVDVEDALIP